MEGLAGLWGGWYGWAGERVCWWWGQVRQLPDVVVLQRHPLYRTITSPVSHRHPNTMYFLPHTTKDHVPSGTSETMERQLLD